MSIGTFFYNTALFVLLETLSMFIAKNIINSLYHVDVYIENSNIVLIVKRLKTLLHALNFTSITVFFI